MPAANVQIDLIAGESMKIMGPGKLSFQAPGVAKAAIGNGATTGMATGGKAAAAMKGSTATAGTIWTGKGLTLGLGLGLGAWGPVLLATAVVGGYAYYKRKQSAKWWPL
jgi:hypothetical protein